MREALRMMRAAISRSWHWLFDKGDLTAWQCVAGLLILVFAIERLAASFFYDRFGVTLEEVGIGYGESLLEGVVLFVFLLVVLNFLVLIPAIAVIFDSWAHFSATVREFWRVARHDPKTMLAYAMHRLSFVVLLALIILLHGMIETWMLVAVGAAALLFLFVVGDRLTHPFAAERASIAIDRELVLRRTFVVTFVLALLLLLTLLGVAFHWATRDSGAAARGLAVSGFPAVAWRAQPVTVHWLDRAAEKPAVISALDGHCVMYLGQTDGVSVLYDVDEQHTLRLPMDGIMLQTYSRTGSPTPCAAISTSLRPGYRPALRRCNPARDGGARCRTSTILL